MYDRKAAAFRMRDIATRKTTKHPRRAGAGGGDGEIAPHPSPSISTRLSSGQSEDVDALVGRPRHALPAARSDVNAEHWERIHVVACTSSNSRSSRGDGGSGGMREEKTGERDVVVLFVT